MVLVYLNQGSQLTSGQIAESVKTNPAFVRKIMKELKEGGLILSSQGKARPVLALPAEKITLLDVYKAVEKDKPLLHLDTHTNPECDIGVNIQYALQDYYDEIQKKIEDEMNQVTIANIVETFFEKADSYKKDDRQ